MSETPYRLAPVDEVMGMIDEYATRYRGWNVRHYYKYYREGGGKLKLHVGEEQAAIERIVDRKIELIAFSFPRTISTVSLY